jgi:hypothetical protein
MSRRPQEPPRSVSRHHRPTFLKTRGIVGSYSKRVAPVNIFLERKIHAVKSGSYAHPIARRARAGPAFKKFQEKRFAKSTLRVF